MSDESTGVITHLLVEWQGGDEQALARLTPLVYSDLRRLAGSYLQHEREGHTLETRDLIHEAFLRLIDQQKVDWQSRAHFFGRARWSRRSASRSPIGRAPPRSRRRPPAPGERARGSLRAGFRAISTTSFSSRSPRKEDGATPRSSSWPRTWSTSAPGGS